VVEWIATVGAVLGLIGTVLGLMSTWSGLTRDRPRLRVRLVWVVYGGSAERPFRITSRRKDAIQQHPDGQFGIELINRGYVPVRVAEVGLTADRFAWWRRFAEFPHPAPRIWASQDDEQLPSMPVEVPVGGMVLIVAAPGLRDFAKQRRARRVYAISEDERLFVARSALLAGLGRR
jgi:hypothetical protein